MKENRKDFRKKQQKESLSSTRINFYAVGYMDKSTGLFAVLHL